MPHVLGQVWLDPSVDRSSGLTRGCHHTLSPSQLSRFRRCRALRPLPAWGGSPPAASSPPRRCAPSPAFAGAGFVGKRTGDHHALLLGQQFDQPGIALGSLAAQHRHRAPSGRARGQAVDQQTSQIAVAALADRAEPYFAAGAVLARRQAERSREVPTALEGLGIDDHRCHRAGHSLPSRRRGIGP